MVPADGGIQRCDKSHIDLEIGEMERNQVDKVSCCFLDIPRTRK